MEECLDSAASNKGLSLGFHAAGSTGRDAHYTPSRLGSRSSAGGILLDAQAEPAGGDGVPPAAAATIAEDYVHVSLPAGTGNSAECTVSEECHTAEGSEGTEGPAAGSSLVVDTAAAGPLEAR